MTIRFVTTCHEAGWNEYGHKCLAGWNLLPKNSELWWYTEGYSIPETDRVTQIDNTTLNGLQEFKKKYAYYISPDYTMDVVRFSHKVFSVYDALINHDGLGVWMDSDIVPFNKMPEGYVESQLPDGNYISLYKRHGTHSECGWWVVDCLHQGHKTFMNSLLDMYVKDGFREAQEWNDCYLMDIVIRNLEKRGIIKSNDLSGVHGRHEHPMATADISKYVDHLKGYSRKASGLSLENPNRKAA